MEEIFYEIKDEIRLKVATELHSILSRAFSGELTVPESGELLNKLTNSFEDENDRRYCDFTIRTLLQHYANDLEGSIYE